MIGLALYLVLLVLMAAILVIPCLFVFHLLLALVGLGLRRLRLYVFPKRTQSDWQSTKKREPDAISIHYAKCFIEDFLKTYPYAKYAINGLKRVGAIQHRKYNTTQPSYQSARSDAPKVVPNPVNDILNHQVNNTTKKDASA